MKKSIIMFLSLLLIVGTMLFNPATSNAAENVNQGVIDLKNLDELEKTGEVTIEEITYEEMIHKISESKGISKKEAQSLHPNRISIDANQVNSEFSTSIGIQSTTLHEIKLRQAVSTIYRPAIQLFVWTYNSGSFTQFNSIEEMDLDRKDISTSLSKQFQGKLRAEIQSGSKIWWYINGDFYNNGQTTVSGTVSADGVIWSGSGTISNVSSHYKYWNNSGTYAR